MSILTLTLNPCIDRTLWVDEHGAPPRREEFQTGGKGVNAARVLRALGVPALAVCPVGGAPGARFLELARAEGVEVVPVPVDAPTRRIDTYVRARDYDQKVDYARGGALSEAELDRLEEEVFARLPSARAFAVCGAASCDAAARRVPDILRRAKELGVPTLLDSNGPALAYGVEAAPDLVKPNQRELFELTGVEDDLPRAAGALFARGVKAVLASLGADGCAYIAPDAEHYCPAPRVRTVNAVGSGDSFVAGFLYASVKGYALEASLMIACAAGAANAAQFPAARIEKKDVEALLGWALS